MDRNERGRLPASAVRADAVNVAMYANEDGMNKGGRGTRTRTEIVNIKRRNARLEGEGWSATMSSNARETTGEPERDARRAPERDATDVDEMMRTAWLLRENVLPTMAAPTNVAMLAASFPPLLLGPVMRRYARTSRDAPCMSDLAIELLSSWLRANPTKPIPAYQRSGSGGGGRVVPFEIVGAVARGIVGRLAGAVRRVGLGPDDSVAAVVPPARYAVWSVGVLCRRECLISHACARGMVDVIERAALPQLCMGRGDAISQHALARACDSGHADALRALARPPYSLGTADAMARDAEALKLACLGGHADVVRALALPPYSLGHAATSRGALDCAARGGSVEVLRILGEPPYCVGQSDARPSPADGGAGDSDGSVDTPLLHARDAAIVAALARPPFMLGRADALAGDCCAFRDACVMGYCDIVRALSLPPYSLGAAEARMHDSACLADAFGRGHLDVVAVLANPPYSLAGADSRANGNAILHAACLRGDADAARVLGRPPFSLSRADATDGTRSAFRAACMHGRVDVLDVLASESYSLDGRDARADDDVLLPDSCFFGNGAVVRRLSQPPYSLDGGDARARRCEALRNACASDDAELLRILGEPPYSLGRADAAAGDYGGIYARFPGANGALIEACCHGATRAIEALGKPPYSLGQGDAMAFDGAAMRAAVHTRYWSCVVDALARPPYLVRPHYRGAAEHHGAPMDGQDAEEPEFIGPERIWGGRAPDGAVYGDTGVSGPRATPSPHPTTALVSARFDSALEIRR